MARIEGFGQTRDVEITVLVDNQADLLVRSSETVRRFDDEPLLAEHGFAALVDLKAAGVRILWDAGLTDLSLIENARRMKLDLATIDVIALSHGHRDHYAALSRVLTVAAAQPEKREWEGAVTAEEVERWQRRHRVPVVAQAAAFRERWRVDKGGRKHGPYSVPRAEWVAAGAEVVESKGPHRLGPGCWTTGAVPRHSFEQAGLPPRRFFREGDELLPDDLVDDQSIVINIEDKGLVVLTGCAHAGILNTVAYAQAISGVDRVWAILGGFHLAPAKDEEIERTIDGIALLAPQTVSPTHCSGFEAVRRFAGRMPSAFVQCVVGTTFVF